MDMDMPVSESENDIQSPPDLINDLVPKLKSISADESKFSSITLLIVTVILFFSAEIISAQWQEILILIGVLLFHELGHLIAMKLLKYNDVKMFFIPFFGAAVTGKSRNDTAVKSCIVSLMGPLPGILLSVFLFFLFLLTKNFYVFKTAQVMLLLNAFNFLPLMPLDGGRCIDVLFINRRYFRFLLSFAGASIFLTLSYASEDIVIGLIGIVTIYAALSNFKLHGISNKLKAQGVNAHSVDALIKDEGALQTVIDKLQFAYPKLFQPKLIPKAIHNHLKVIVGTLKFVPAKLLPKIVLLFSYLSLVSVSLLTTFFLLAANYRETPRAEKADGHKNIYAETHLFGAKRAECTVDEDLFYHGKGTRFSSNPGEISAVYYYENGYRTGEWLTFNEAGETIMKKIYEKGRLLSVATLENGEWKTYAYKDLSSTRKFLEEIQRLSQPVKSNYRYFD